MRLTLAALILAATFSTSALATDCAVINYTIIGNVGIGSGRVDSVVGITGQANNLVRGFGVYTTVNKVFMNNSRADAAKAVRIPNMFGVNAEYKGFVWALGTTYTYENLVGYMGFTQSSTTIDTTYGYKVRTSVGETRSKDKYENHYASKHDKQVVNGVDLGLQYNTHPIIVGIGYNSATKTTQMSVGYAF